MSFVKTENNNQDTDYIGKVHVYDSFHTQKVMLLNVRVKYYYCEKKETSTIVFRLSPKGFDSDIWQKFKKARLLVNICEN